MAINVAIATGIQLANCPSPDQRSLTLWFKIGLWTGWLKYLNFLTESKFSTLTVPMNVPVDSATPQVSNLSDQPLQQSGVLAQHLSSSELPIGEIGRETAPAADDKICWIEVRQSAYPPDQQVELLHLQAEAEALLLQLQAMHQRRQDAVEGDGDAP